MNSTTNLDAQCVVDFPSRDTLYCSVPIDSFPQLELEDISNCPATSVTLQNQTMQNLNCGDPEIYAKYYRTWLIETMSGPEIFNDIICLARIDLADIEFPSDTTFDCALGDTTLASTGYPTANGAPIVGSFPHCNLWVGLISTTVVPNPNCPHEVKITRKWTIKDLCDPMAPPLEGMQTIHIDDSTAPVIILPTEIDECTEVNKCGADFTFPPPNILSDNCIDSADVQLQIEIVNTDNSPTPYLVTNGMVSDVPPGLYKAIYTADDGCGNLSKDTAQLSIADKTPPLAQGEDKVLQFNAGVSMMTLAAENFDNGSSDACASTVHFKVRRMDAPVGYICANTGNPDNMFDDAIKFCCDDVGTPVMVILRVYDRPPGMGLVSDDHLLPFSADFMLMVTVLDKSAPEIQCISDDTLDCTEDLFDLSRLGTPLVEDNCGATIALDTTIYDLNECNVGCIIRRFIARDMAGLADTCDQKIVVRSKNPFDGSNPDFLIWPRDTVLTSCDAPTDTAKTGAPVILIGGSCAQIIFSYQDELFQYVENACFKILRRWKVYDWCQFDGSEANPFTPSPGVWFHTQVIKVKDLLPPELLLPPEITVPSESEDCSMANVTIPPFLASDCSAPKDLEFTYKVDLFNDGGAYDRSGVGNNASGEYPIGTHKLHVFVNDGCGNITDDTMLVKVVDLKPPTAILSGSLVAELMRMDDGGMVPVPARLFKSKSFDNCTSPNNLRYAFSEDISDSVRIFTCDSLGIRNVNIYVFDEAGNFDFVKNKLEIQDNMSVCPAITVVQGTGSQTSISGQINTALGVGVERVGINMIYQGVEVPTTTNRKGNYAFSKVDMYKDYQIVPNKEINPLNGISTLDIVRITKHLLGSEPFESPYQIIASDINRNGSITTLDVVHLRKLILGIIPNFRDEKSWEFVDADYKFIDPVNPLSEAYPTIYNIKELSEKMSIDFIGIKLGDVNYSAQPNRLSNAQTRSVNKLPLYVEKKQLPDGQTELSFYLKGIPAFDGIQLALNILGEDVEIITNGSLGKDCFFYQNDLKELRVSWNLDATRDMLDQRLFTLVLKPINANAVSDIVSIKESFLESEIYSANEVNGLRIEDYKNKKVSASAFEVKQNKPNPFTGETAIEFSLNQDQQVRFTIYDIDGNLIHSRQLSLLKGHHELRVNEEHIPQAGIYIYELQSLLQTARNKMIKVN